MHIKLKEANKSAKMNRVLKSMAIKGCFVTRNQNQGILDDINKNPNSSYRHLKPENGDMTMKQLKEVFPVWTEEGLFDADLYFERTDASQMQKIAQFILENKDCIKYIKDSETLIERGELALSNEDLKLIRSLEKHEDEIVLIDSPAEEIKKQQELQGGILLCKSFSIQPFWVLYGNVKKPTFMKEVKYENEDTGLYRDAKGLGYMLIPLNDLSPDFGEKVYERAHAMGLREHPLFFLPYCYSFGMTDFRVVANDFVDYYTEKELEERFELMYFEELRKLKSFGYRMPITFQVNPSNFIKMENAESGLTLKEKLDLLRALAQSIYLVKGDKFQDYIHSLWEKFIKE